jgi:hypothetical protein
VIKLVTLPSFPRQTFLLLPGAHSGQFGPTAFLSK